MAMTTAYSTPAQESTRIQGVYIMPIRVFADERGRFMETFRREWFPWINWDKMQGNRSDSKKHVLRGLHYHHHQIDYWYVTSGVVRAAVADLRPSSPTYGAVETIEIGDDYNLGLFIPVGVAHGFVALTEVTLTYIVNNYYDGKDEYGVAWNDPELKVRWGVENPIISGRDAQNPRLKDIPAAHLPE